MHVRSATGGGCGPVDVPFVMAMQSARFIVVAFCGPAIARFVARRIPA